MNPRLLRAFAALSLLCVPHLASGQTGVSDDRVSLPDGPGSLEGIGENVDIDPNMGLMRYSVKINTPKGFGHVEPNLSLSYSSGGGNSVVGMGWSMPLPHIERMTYRGLPKYTLDDDFSLDGSYQMVRIPGTDPPTFRTRYEQDFIRYTWFPGTDEAADGANGWFLVEYKDGTKAYYGADRNGEIVDGARMQGDLGTFKYMLVDKVDVHGNRTRYTYTRDGVIPLPETINYVFPDYLNGEPRYRVTFEYEDRRDDDGLDYLSDCAPGYETLLTQRLAAVNVWSLAERIRRYELEYEGYEASGGFTRLLGVSQIGLDGGVYPVRETFTYSRALGGVCEDGEAGCEDAFLVDMGPIGDVDLGAGTATLIDINGDALPDIVNTNEGAHEFVMNVPSSDGTSSFAGGVVTSQAGFSAGHRLGGGITQVMDVNGDGFSDLVNTATGDVLYNRGAGDWLSADEVRAEGIPAFDATFDALGEGQLGQVSFLDYDNNKFIDFIVSTPEQTTIYANLDEDGFEAAPGIQLIGDGETGEDLEFSDINGDGLLDAAIIRPGEVRYRLNLGWGRWAEWESMPHPYELGAQLELAQLEDINGDGVDDLVVVEADLVRYLLNVAGIRFTEEFVIDAQTIGEALPERNEATQVLFADMNGNGSTDIVWVQRMGSARYLEMFPVRPNLMSRIENGIGQVTDVTYSTSVQYLAADAEAAGGDPDVWAYKLPHPMLVVSRIDVWERLAEIHQITDYVYHDGFYDGVEKQFRGYARVESLLRGGEGHEDGEKRETFDVGANDPYFNGLKLTEDQYSDGRPLMTMLNTYEDCPLAEVPDEAQLDLPVRFICMTGSRTILKEGQPESDWVTIESRMGYDGYGNVDREENLGVVQVGGGGCEPCETEEFGRPCGESCVGDELYIEREFITPGADSNDRWFVKTPWRERQYGVAGGPVAEMTMYFDGDPYVGLPAGQQDEGLLTRREVKVIDGDDRVIEIDRIRYDDRGNVVETLDPLADIDGQTHRRVYTIDDDGLRIVAVDIMLEDREGEPYVLRQEMQYEPVFDRIVEGTEFMRIRDGQSMDERRSTFYGYDEFGRMVWMTEAGDSPATPTMEVEYDLGSPVSRIITRNRSTSGGPLDLVGVNCFDGRGRTYQTRNEITNDEVQVDGFATFNARGTLYRDYQPYMSDSLECDEEPPEDTLYKTHFRDAQFRVTSVTDEDSEVHGSNSITRVEYGPLWLKVHDREDTDPASPHADTPTVTYSNGLGKVVAMDRVLEGGAIATTEMHYDTLGRFTGYTDAAGNRKTLSYDLIGRVLDVDDPNQGRTSYAYDDHGNMVSRIDATGTTYRMVYDGDNRLVEFWDDADREGTEVNQYYDFTVSCPAVDCTHPAGRMVERRHPEGQAWFGYDIRGLESYAAQEIEGHLMEFRKAYDAANRVASVTYPDERELEINYDGGSRFEGITDVIEEIVYDERDLATEMRFANGTFELMEFNARQQLEALAVLTESEEVLYGYTIRRDRMSNVLEVTDDSADADRLVGLGLEAAYDAWYRPTELHLAPESEGEEVLTYTYDLIDNITSISSDRGAESPAHVGAMTYGAHGPNAIDQAGDRSYGYDAAGRMNRHDGAMLTWDFQDRLVAYAGAIDAEYTYESNHVRVFKREGDLTVMYPSDDFEVRDGIAVINVQVEGRHVARLENPEFAVEIYSDLAPQDDPDGAITVADAWLAYANAEGLVEVEVDADEITDPVLLLASGTRRLLIEDRESTWLHADLLGSVVLATRDGAETGRQGFYPTGLPRLTASINPYGFTGHEHDTTGLIATPFRYLDPYTGRWIMPDPLYRSPNAGQMGEVGQATVGYAYVSNSFTGLIDPLGLGNGHPHKTKMQRVGSVMTSVTNLFTAVKANAKEKTGVTKVETAIKNHQLSKTETNGKGTMTQLSDLRRQQTRLRDYDASATETGLAKGAEFIAKKGTKAATGNIPVVSSVASTATGTVVKEAVYLKGDIQRIKDNPALINNDAMQDTKTLSKKIGSVAQSMKNVFKSSTPKPLLLQQNSTSISEDATFQDQTHDPIDPSGTDDNGDDGAGGTGG